MQRKYVVTMSPRFKKDNDESACNNLFHLQFMQNLCVRVCVWTEIVMELIISGTMISGKNAIGFRSLVLSCFQDINLYLPSVSTQTIPNASLVVVVLRQKATKSSSYIVGFKMDLISIPNGFSVHYPLFVCTVLRCTSFTLNKIVCCS